MIFRVEFEPFLVEEVPNVNDVSWQWVPDTVCYVEGNSKPTCLEELVDCEFLCNEESFYNYYSVE